MKNNKLISLVLALLVCFSLVLTASATTDNTNLTLAVEANPSTVVYGNTIKVSVMANENPGFLCVNFQIMWDTSVLEFVSADTTGSSFTEVEANHQEKFNKVVITVGDPYIALNYPNMATKFTGTGKIVDLTFKVKEGANADNTANVYFENPSFVSLDGKSSETMTTKDLPVVVLSTSHVHKSAKPATCTEPEVCAQCGAQMAPAVGHKPGVATCTASQTCEVCNVELAPAAGHKPGAAATCTTAQTCTVCKVQVAPAKGHAAKTVAAKAPTCTDTGLTAGSVCSACGITLKEQDVVPADGHKMSTTWVNTDASSHWRVCLTCGTKGDIAAHTLVDGTCSVCGYGCTHIGGTATCTEQAVCTICGKAYGELKAHTPGAAATCTSEQKCTVCQTVIAEKLTHNLEKVDAKAATCGAIGWDAYEKCKDCDYTTYKENAATGAHTFGEWVVVKKATLNATGEQTHTCSVCNFAESEVIPVQEFPVVLVVVLVVLVAAVVVLIIVIKKKKK